MKIITLIENLVTDMALVAEHGLSFSIEAGDKRILFDTGAGPDFEKNAIVLGIDISEVDYLVVSHGHYDHIGGLTRFLEVNEKAAIYLKKESLEAKYSGDRYIGVSSVIDKSLSRFRFVTAITEIVPGVFVMPSTINYFSIDRHWNGFFREQNGNRKADEFDDELFLCIRKDEKLTIISSCSHNGITNIAETAREYFRLPVERVIGGFHTKNDSVESIKSIAGYFNVAGVGEVHTCHCTGIEQYVHLKNECRSDVKYNQTGSIIII